MKSNVEIAAELLDARRDVTQFAETGRVYINCPFSEKDRAKGLGAKWDAGQKLWYIPAGVDPKPFKAWMTKPVVKPTPNSYGLFLVNLKKQNSVAHLWNGTDTVCKLYSTGGMSKKKKTVSTTTHGRELCATCLSVNSRSKNPVLFVDDEYNKSVEEFTAPLPML